MTRLTLTQVAGHVVESGRPALWRLDAATTLIEQAELVRVELVHQLREQGESWTKIGQQLGMSKQAAQQRYGPKPKQKQDADQLTIEVE